MGMMSMTFRRTKSNIISKLKKIPYQSYTLDNFKLPNIPKFFIDFVLGAYKMINEILVIIDKSYRSSTSKIQQELVIFK